MALKELPVRSDISSQTFVTTLEGTDYLFRLRYNERMDRWIMDIMTPAGEDILLGIPLLTNLPLAFRYRDARLPPGQFFVIDETGQNRNPGKDDLGNDIKLLYQESTG